MVENVSYIHQKRMDKDNVRRNRQVGRHTIEGDVFEMEAEPYLTSYARRLLLEQWRARNGYIHTYKKHGSEIICRKGDEEHILSIVQKVSGTNLYQCVYPTDRLHHRPSVLYKRLLRMVTGPSPPLQAHYVTH